MALNNQLIFLFLFLISTILLNCKTSSQIHPSTEFSTEAYTPTIITIILRANKDQSLLEVENIIRSKGWLKENYDSELEELQERHYVFSFLDKNEAIVSIVQLPSPLIQRYEVPHDDGSLESVVVEKETEIITLRINETENLSVLKIEIVKDKKQQFLQNIDL